ELKRNGNGTVGNRDGPEPISLNSNYLLTSFAIYSIGCGISLSCFVLELFLYWVHFKLILLTLVQFARRAYRWIQDKAKMCWSTLQNFRVRIRYRIRLGLHRVRFYLDHKCFS